MNELANMAFIVGTGRCGTSWLAQMMNNHTELCAPPEIQCLFEYSDNGDRLFELFSHAGPEGPDGQQIASCIEKGCPARLEQFFDYREFCSRPSTPRDSLQAFAAAFYSAIAKFYGKSWLIEQTPWYGTRIDLLVHFFPAAKIIHMVRDGRDVALSFARTPWWYASPRLNLARWQREIKKISLDAVAYLDARTYLEVRYEDLVKNTEAELRRVCEFLGVAFDRAMLDSQKFIDYDQLSKFDVRQASSPSYNAWRQCKDTAGFSGSSYAWRLTPDLFHAPLPEEIVHWLKHFQYTVDEDCPDGVDALEYQRGYSLYALEPMLEARAETIRTLEQALASQVQRNEPVISDWAARGEYIDRLAHSLSSLQEEWACRELEIKQVIQSIEERKSQLERESLELTTTNAVLTEKVCALEQAAKKQAEYTQIVVEDWTARGEQIDHLGREIYKLQADLIQRERDTSRLNRATETQEEDVSKAGVGGVDQ